jgi:hypothetical protein
LIRFGLAPRIEGSQVLALSQRLGESLKKVLHPLYP